MYIYIKFYIYIYIHICIYIGGTRWNGDNTSKSKTIFPTSFGRGRTQKICRICDFATDVSCFRPYAKTKNNEGEWKVCMEWIQFRS